jgi:hypothetical protein
MNPGQARRPMQRCRKGASQMNNTPSGPAVKESHIEDRQGIGAFNAADDAWRQRDLQAADDAV